MICPRCDGDTALEYTQAYDGSWKLFRCQACYFIWRSTEPDYIKDKDAYDPRFKIDPESIKQAHQNPPIPPLKR